MHYRDGVYVHIFLQIRTGSTGCKTRRKACLSSFPRRRNHYSTGCNRANSTKAGRLVCLLVLHPSASSAATGGQFQYFTKPKFAFCVNKAQSSLQVSSLTQRYKVIRKETAFCFRTGPLLVIFEYGRQGRTHNCYWEWGTGQPIYNLYFILQTVIKIMS